MTTATEKIVPGTKTALTSSSFATLASGYYCVSSAYANTNQEEDCLVEVTAGTTNTPSGNKKVDIFVQASYDGGTTWQSGPSSGNSTTDEELLTWIGSLKINTTSVNVTKAYSVAAMMPNNLMPPMHRVVTKNDLGVALTTGTLSTIEYIDTSVTP